jgi:hypothetical protein
MVVDGDDRAATTIIKFVTAGIQFQVGTDIVVALCVFRVQKRAYEVCFVGKSKLMHELSKLPKLKPSDCFRVLLTDLMRNCVCLDPQDLQLYRAGQAVVTDFVNTHIHDAAAWESIPLKRSSAFATLLALDKKKQIKAAADAKRREAQLAEKKKRDREEAAKLLRERGKERRKETALKKAAAKKKRDAAKAKQAQKEAAKLKAAAKKLAAKRLAEKRAADKRAADAEKMRLREKKAFEDQLAKYRRGHQEMSGRLNEQKKEFERETGKLKEQLKELQRAAQPQKRQRDDDEIVSVVLRKLIATAQNPLRVASPPRWIPPPTVNPVTPWTPPNPTSRQVLGAFNGQFGRSTIQPGTTLAELFRHVGTF